ncbi:MAG: hypothetical protein ACU0A6_13250 [Shimia sp.]|uniref:hypothetical protein n=1 Tax=Shimia sp. TaxID=1954381 RepID=UPI0040583F39
MFDHIQHVPSNSLQKSHDPELSVAGGRFRLAVMMDAQTLDQKTDAVLSLARAKFGVRKRSLPKAMKKIGRRVPSWVHREAAVIDEARELAGHPKLMVHMDSARVQKAFDAITAHLQTIDRRERRVDRTLDVLGSLSFNLIVLTALVILFLRWQGLI